MVLEFILNMMLLISLISLFNLARYLFKIKKVLKQHKDNPNIQGISIVNGEVKVIEKVTSQQIEQPIIPKVVDEICGKEVNKAEAYRVVKGEQEHYFCSWECREAFVKRKQEEGE